MVVGVWVLCVTRKRHWAAAVVLGFSSLVKPPSDSKSWGHFHSHSPVCVPLGQHGTQVGMALLWSQGRFQSLPDCLWNLYLGFYSLRSLHISSLVTTDLLSASLPLQQGGVRCRAPGRVHGQQWCVSWMKASRNGRGDLKLPVQGATEP